MTEETQDTTEVALESEEKTGFEGEGTAETEKKSKPFTPEQEQYLGSWLGRIVAKQFDEKVLPIVGDRLPQPPQPDQPGILEKFNEDISAEFFTNPYNAFKKMMDVYQGTQTTLSKNQKTQVDKALMSYSDKPYYKEIFGNMQKTARMAISEGYPPEAAVEYGYQLARADFLDKKDSEDDLSLLEGGLPRKINKNKKLPPQFKAAYIRDHDAGLFKTEQEFIDNLSPIIRERYGL